MADKISRLKQFLGDTHPICIFPTRKAALESDTISEVGISTTDVLCGIVEILALAGYAIVMLYN
jgi:hypothetical protein